MQAVLAFGLVAIKEIKVVASLGGALVLLLGWRVRALALAWQC